MKWQKILKAIDSYFYDIPDMQTLQQAILEVEDMIMDFVYDDRFKPYMEQLNEDLQEVKRETDFTMAVKMFNGLHDSIDKLVDEHAGGLPTRLQK